MRFGGHFDRPLKQPVQPLLILVNTRNHLWDISDHLEKLILLIKIESNPHKSLAMLGVWRKLCCGGHLEKRPKQPVEPFIFHFLKNRGAL